MKKLLLLVIMAACLATAAAAAPVTVTWEPNAPEEQVAIYEVGLVQLDGEGIPVSVGAFNPTQSWSTYETALTLPDTATKIGQVYQLGGRAVNVYGLYSPWQMYCATGKLAIVDLRNPTAPHGLTIIIQIVQ